MTNTAVIVGAGSGKRMDDIEKALIEINDKPLIAHTLNPFQKCKVIDDVVVVVKKKSIDKIKKIIDDYNIDKCVKVICGGYSRQESVYNGIKQCIDSDYILIHDMARPIITTCMIEKIVNECYKHNAVTFAIEPTNTIIESLKSKEPNIVNNYLNRNNIKLLQTPQMFKQNLIKNAHEYALINNITCTDDSGLIKHFGHDIFLIEGKDSNIKLTYNSNLPIIEHYLKHMHIVNFNKN